MNLCPSSVVSLKWIPKTGITEPRNTNFPKCVDSQVAKLLPQNLEPVFTPTLFHQTPVNTTDHPLRYLPISQKVVSCSVYLPLTSNEVNIVIEEKIAKSSFPHFLGEAGMFYWRRDAELVFYSNAPR